MATHQPRVTSQASQGQTLFVWQTPLSCDLLPLPVQLVKHPAYVDFGKPVNTSALNTNFCRFTAAAVVVPAEQRAAYGEYKMRLRLDTLPDLKGLRLVQSRDIEPSKELLASLHNLLALPPGIQGKDADDALYQAWCLGTDALDTLASGADLDAVLAGTRS